jgi:EAL domain-containing protein (putative c-di-GMP-specific phosphodiesterase class I)
MTTILLEDIRGVNDAPRVAERIQAELKEPFVFDGHEVFTSASIGIALSTAGHDRPEYFLRDADTAMYRAKARGKARYEMFDEAMHVRAVAQLQLETDLRRALERGEFRVRYQPIVACRRPARHGFEALMRWEHPDRGLVPPMEFIPVAEDTGLIAQIGEWGFGEACRQMRTWHERVSTQPPLMISVNLSGKQFVQPDLADRIERILHETGLSPESLKIEITESVLMDNPESAALMLARFRALNVQISLDDFGTGYSSLGYLHRSIDTLKVDRSFVNAMGREGEGSELVRTIITLAHSMGMTVVAEGAETKEQVAQLTALGCEYAQGYFFAKPMSAEDAAALIAAAPDWPKAA